MEGSNVQMGVLCNNFVSFVEFTDACPNAMHVVSWAAIQDMEAQCVKHCTQHVHGGAQVHDMQFIHFQTLAWQIFEAKDKVECSGVVQLSPLAY